MQPFTHLSKQMVFNMAITLANANGQREKAAGKGNGAKGNRHFPKLFTRLPLNAFFLSCHRFCCCFAHDFCRRVACKTALSIGNPMIHFHSRLPPSMATPCGTKHYYLFPSLGHNLPKSWQHDGQRRIVSPNWQSGLISSLSLQPLHPLQARHTAHSS